MDKFVLSLRGACHRQRRHSNRQESGQLRRLTEKWKIFASSEDALARVFRNSAWMFSAKGFGGVASLFYLAVLTRSLGPAGFGQFILIVSTIQILSALVRLQTWQTVVHFGAPLLLKDDRKGFSRVAWEEFLVEGVGAAVALLVVYLVLEPLALSWGWEPAMIRGLELYGLIIFLSLRSTTTGILRADDRFRDTAIGDAAIPLVRLLGVFILIFIGPSVTGFLIVWGLSETASSIVQFFLVMKRKLLGMPGPKFEQPGYWTFLFATNASFLLLVLRERGAVLVIGLFAGEAAAGVFRLADQVASSVNRVSEIFSRPLFTEMSRLYGVGEQERSRDLFYRSLRISAISGAGIMLALLVLGYPVIYLMSGEAFLSAYPLLLILGGSTIIGLASLGLEPLLQAAGHPAKAFFARLAGLGVMALGLFTLLGPFGVTGASWAMLAASVATLIIMLYLVLKLLGYSRKSALTMSGK